MPKKKYTKMKIDIQALPPKEREAFEFMEEKGLEKEVSSYLRELGCPEIN